MPLQSGSTNVLKVMNRKYTKEQYLALVEKMKNKIPNLTLSTDIIVGFPGETEEDFEDTLDVVRKVCFEQVYMFIYSRRVGTPGDRMENQIPEEIKHKRFSRLKELVESQIEQNNQKYVGTMKKVLVEGPSKNNPELLTGRTDSNKVVIFKGEKELINKVIDIKIVSEHMWYLKGEIMNEYSNLDTAIEIMAYKMADCVKKVEKDESYKEELEKLRKERNEMYNGNIDMIHKIIDVYGKEIKELYNKNN